MLPDSEGNRALDRQGVSSVAAVALGSAALVGGLAFYMGWSYERAYINEWDLPFSAFSYSPYELMVASRRTSSMALLMALPILNLVAWRALIGDREPKFPGWWDFAEGIVLLLGMSSIIAGAFVAADRPEHANTVVYGTFLTTLSFALVLALTFSIGSSRAGSRLLLLFIALVFFVIFTSTVLGKGDALLDKRDPERMPRVEVTLQEADGVVSGGRVIRVNNGSFWLANEGTLEVLQIDADAISQVRYLPKQ